jgi:hypothetical protein
MQGSAPEANDVSTGATGGGGGVGGIGLVGLIGGAALLAARGNENSAVAMTSDDDEEKFAKE